MKAEPDEIKATSGYFYFGWWYYISWKSTKQKLISRSIIEAEFIALDLTSKKAEWLRCLIVDIPIFLTTNPAMSLLL